MNAVLKLEVNKPNEPKTDSLPSISASASLVRLSISQWLGTTTDKQVTDEVQSQKGATKGSVRVNKLLLPNEPMFEQVKYILGLMRNTYYHYTMPWEDRGARLLTTRLFFTFNEELNRLNTEFKDALANFVAEYPAMLSRAPSKLQGLWSPADYPDPFEIADKFAVAIQYAPVPEAGDFRVNVGLEALEQMKASYADYYEEKLKGAYADAWERTHEVLSHMSKKLEGEKKQKFNDSLVSNVTDMVELLKGFNVTNDPEMDRMARRMEDVLRGVTPDGLRTCDGHRLETKRKVDEILNDFSW